MTAWEVATYTDCGYLRSANEDSVFINGRFLPVEMEKPWLFSSHGSQCILMIADGMGGHIHGALASRTALEWLSQCSLSEPTACREAIQAANSHLYELMSQRPELTGMGTTLVGVILTTAQILCFNIGDSRAYLNTNDFLIQLSQDDRPSERQLGVDKKSGGITQALGGSPFHLPIEPHISSEPPLRDGEILLLCSDGLTDLVAEEDIRAWLSTKTSLCDMAKGLCTHALHAGGRDNISIILARPSGTDAT